MPRAYGTHLYILQAGELIKVGRSMNVPRRLKELRHSNPWGDIKLLAEFPGAGCLETWVLRVLSAHERRGEWVKCSVAEVMAAVGEAWV
jgi:hypothetical protein